MVRLKHRGRRMPAVVFSGRQGGREKYRTFVGIYRPNPVHCGGVKRPAVCCVYMRSHAA